MLVLSRRPGEKVLFPTIPAVLKVISSQAGLVRIGIEAPSHVPIVREEVFQGEKSSPPTTPAGSVPAPTSHAAACPVVRHRFDNLVLALTLLRLHLAESEPAVLGMLDGMEAEVRALGVQLEAPDGEPEVSTARRPPARARASRRRVRPV